MGDPFTKYSVKRSMELFDFLPMVIHPGRGVYLIGAKDPPGSLIQRTECIRKFN